MPRTCRHNCVSTLTSLQEDECTVNEGILSAYKDMAILNALSDTMQDLSPDAVTIKLDDDCKLNVKKSLRCGALLKRGEFLSTEKGQKWKQCFVNDVMTECEAASSRLRALMKHVESVDSSEDLIEYSAFGTEDADMSEDDDAEVEEEEQVDGENCEDSEDEDEEAVEENGDEEVEEEEEIDEDDQDEMNDELGGGLNESEMAMLYGDMALDEDDDDEDEDSFFGITREGQASAQQTRKFNGRNRGFDSKKHGRKH